MPISNEERLRRRRESFHKETPEQKNQRRLWCRESYQRHKEVRSATAKLKRQEPGEAEKAYNHKRKYYQTYPARYLLMLARKRCKDDNIPYNLEESDIFIPEYCPILQIKLLPVFSEMKDRRFGPTLDRIDKTKGYTKGNVRVISFEANNYKSDMSLEDIERLFLYSKGML